MKRRRGVTLKPVYFCDDFLLSLASYEDMEAYKHVLDEQEFAKLKGRTEEDNPFSCKMLFQMRKLAPLKVATIFLACLYDYGSRLVKVVDLGMPVVRIASDRRSNTLYAIGLPKRDLYS